MTFSAKRELDRLVDDLLRTDANRATGARHQLDVRRQRLAQAGHRDRSLMTAADVHHLEAARELQRSKAIKPLPGGDGRGHGGAS